MRTLVPLAAGCLLASCAPASREVFAMTDAKGRMLGFGTIALPFEPGKDGKGEAPWTFAAHPASNNDPRWAKARKILDQGEGTAQASAEQGRLALNFNPGHADHNVTVSWAPAQAAGGTVLYNDIAGGHPCARFTFPHLRTGCRAADPDKRR